MVHTHHQVNHIDSSIMIEISLANCILYRYRTFSIYSLLPLECITQNNRSGFLCVKCIPLNFNYISGTFYSRPTSFYSIG